MRITAKLVSVGEAWNIEFPTVGDLDLIFPKQPDGTYSFDRIAAIHALNSPLITSASSDNGLVMGVACVLIDAVNDWIARNTANDTISRRTARMEKKRERGLVSMCRVDLRTVKIYNEKLRCLQTAVRASVTTKSDGVVENHDYSRYLGRMIAEALESASEDMIKGGMPALVFTPETNQLQKEYKEQDHV